MFASPRHDVSRETLRPFASSADPFSRHPTHASPPRLTRSACVALPLPPPMRLLAPSLPAHAMLANLAHAHAHHAAIPTRASLPASPCVQPVCQLARTTRIHSSTLLFLPSPRPQTPAVTSCRPHSGVSPPDLTLTTPSNPPSNPPANASTRRTTSPDPCFVPSCSVPSLPTLGPFVVVRTSAARPDHTPTHAAFACEPSRRSRLSAHPREPALLPPQSLCASAFAMPGSGSKFTHRRVVPLHRFAVSPEAGELLAKPAPHFFPTKATRRMAFTRTGTTSRHAARMKARATIGPSLHTYLFMDGRYRWSVG